MSNLSAKTGICEPEGEKWAGEKNDAKNEISSLLRCQVTHAKNPVRENTRRLKMNGILANYEPRGEWNTMQHFNLLRFVSGIKLGKN